MGTVNPNDERRDQILRFLYERHKTTRGIQKIPIGIRDLQREMKTRLGMAQPEVASNLDYLVQVGWVREVTKERSFKTGKGMEISAEQVKYKISDVGINHLEAGTTFKKPETAGTINITNVKDVTVVGDGNIVNTQLTDLSRALDDLDRAIASSKLTDEEKLDAAGDLATLRTQIAKKNPLKEVMQGTWRSLEPIATLGGATEAAARVGELIRGYLG
jgi:predicted transcriptional regulator